MSPDEVRTVALGLAEAVEQPHHGFPSFRVGGRIFATMPDDEHLHVMLDETDIRSAAAEWPAWCEEKWWGKKLSAVRVVLSEADAAVVAELLEDAWRMRAAP
jgi:hypothetical protein